MELRMPLTCKIFNSFKKIRLYKILLKTMHSANQTEWPTRKDRGTQFPTTSFWIKCSLMTFFTSLLCFALYDRNCNKWIETLNSKNDQQGKIYKNVKFDDIVRRLLLFIGICALQRGFLTLFCVLIKIKTKENIV